MNAKYPAMRTWLAMTLTLVAFSAWASGTSELRKQTEASMLLTGTVEVAQDGSLRSYQLDQPEKVDAPIREFIDRNVRSWSFMVGPLPPGVSANATILNSMSILVVAKPVEGDMFSLRLAASHFSAKSPAPGTEITPGKMTPPGYPREAVSARVKGKVYLLIKVAPDGAVEDVIAEQVNLGVVGNNEKEMARWRKVLATSALKAARRWTFVVPTPGEQAHQPFFLVRVPVEYEIDRNKKKTEYGEWASYIPGPRLPNQWEQAEDNPGFAPDALAANGGVYSNDGLRLKSPLQGTADGG